MRKHGFANIVTSDEFAAIACMIGIIICVASIIAVRIKEKNFKISKNDAQSIYYLCGMATLVFLMGVFIAGRTALLTR